MPGYTRDLIKTLRQNNCHFVRAGKGDHQIWYSPMSDCNFTVDSDIKSRHTANKSLKDAGIPKAF